MSDGWDIAALARTDFADLIDGLSPKQLASPSLCEGWSAHDVAGHVVSFIEMSLPTMMMSMAKAGFNVHKAWSANAKKYGAQPASEIAKKIRENASHPSSMKSFPGGLTTVDVGVHTQDIRRALDLEGTLDPKVVQGALDFCTTHPKRKMMIPPEYISGLRLEATDMDWSWGEGDLVRGTGEAILMGINSRDVAADLEGDGVAKLPKEHA